MKRLVGEKEFARFSKGECYIADVTVLMDVYEWIDVYLFSVLLTNPS